MITLDGDVACDTCGQILRVGMYPFCPHGEGASAAHTDDIPGGMWLENYGPHPIKVYSYSEAARIRSEQGLNLKERFSPTPGTDIDPAGVMNPKGYVDAQTLANGAALICRQQTGSQTPEFDGVRDGVIRDPFSIVGTTRDAQAVADGDPRRSSRIGRRIGHGG